MTVASLAELARRLEQVENALADAQAPSPQTPPGGGGYPLAHSSRPPGGIVRRPQPHWASSRIASA